MQLLHVLAIIDRKLPIKNATSLLRFRYAHFYKVSNADANTRTERKTESDERRKCDC